MPSQLESPIDDRSKRLKENVMDYSNSTAEMELVNRLEEQPLAWFGFETKRHLNAHVPQRWKGKGRKKNLSSDDIEREKRFYTSGDAATLRGRSLIIFGESPACNRLSNTITRQVLDRLKNAGAQSTVSDDFTLNLLKKVRDAGLRPSRSGS